MVKVYKSAVDLWLAVILIGVPLALLFTGLSIALGLHWLHWHENIGRLAGCLFVGASLVAIGLTFTFILPCRYTLSSSSLGIQCGTLKWAVPYESIRRLELSCSLWIAPALSLNRVKIVLDQNVYLVSPRNRTGFLQDLQSRLDPGTRQA